MFSRTVRDRPPSMAIALAAAAATDHTAAGDWIGHDSATIRRRRGKAGGGGLGGVTCCVYVCVGACVYVCVCVCRGVCACVQNFGCSIAEAQLAGTLQESDGALIARLEALDRAFTAVFTVELAVNMASNLWSRFVTDAW